MSSPWRASHRGVSRKLGVLGASAALAACGSLRTEPGAPGEPTANEASGGALSGSNQSELSGSRNGGASATAQAGLPNSDASAGLGDPAPVATTTCVDGAPVSHGSSQEGGGTAPSLPDVVTRAAAPLPPLSGGTLLALNDGLTLLAADPERDRVYVLDTATSALRATIAMAAGDEPGRIAEDAAGRAHVVLRRGGALASVDVATGTLIGRRAVCSAPRGVAYELTTDQLQVACAGGELVSLPAGGGDATRVLQLESDLRDVVAGVGGALFVSAFRAAKVLAVDGAGQVTASLRPGSGSVTTPFGSTRRSPAVAWRLVKLDDAASRLLMLHQTGITEPVDPGPGGYAGLDGCGAIVQPGLSVLGLGEPSPPVAAGLGSLPLVIDVAVSPDGSKVALAVPGNGIAQGPTLVEAKLSAVTLGESAACSSLANDLRAPLPQAQVVAVAYSKAGVLFAQTRDPLGIWRSDTGQTTLLPAEPRVDTGHFLFHANSGGGLTCASCHPEGGEDGRVWDFSCLGARRTQSLRGGIGATLPFHWDGGEVDFGYLVNDVFTGRMVGPLLSDEQRSALDAWVETIPLLPKATSSEPSTVARGKALFDSEEVGCATCHAGARLTNNATVDVGTGRALQVPSLLGVAHRAPFMHDGCAATLGERFTSAACGGGDRHGSTSALQGSEIDALVAYLASL